MKKIIAIFLFTAISFVGVAQEKGAYLNLSGGLGFTGFDYTLKGINSNGDNQYLPGGQVALGFSYYFNEHWGIVTGFGMSYYRTNGKYSDGLNPDVYYNLGTYADDDFLGQGEFELRARLGNWKEYQRGYFLEIPVMAGYQHRFGKKKQNGVYFGAGVKVQIPIDVKYEVIDGDYESDKRLNISGYYGSEYPDFGNPQDQTIYPHGFGSIHNPNERYGWEAKTKLSPSVALAGELGFLIGLSRRVDLTLGGYIDYGLNNIKKNNNPLLEGPEDYLPEANDNIGEGITYNGMLNSDRIKRVNLVSYGIKVGVRVRLGKVTDRYVEEPVVILEQQEEKLGGIEESLKELIELMKRGEQPKEMKIVLDGVIDRTVSNETSPIISGQSEIDEDGLIEKEREVLKERIFFDKNSSMLHPGSKVILDKKVNLLNQHPDLRLRIIGNTCDLGNEKINIPLGLKRANAVKEYMNEKGIDEHRLVPATQANYDPLLPNTTEDNRAINRRCDFELDRR